LPKLKRNLMRKRYILVVSLAILLLCMGCGKKGLPTPQRLLVPGGIKDLTGIVKDGVLFLSFSIPQKDSSGAEIKDLGGFQVLKSCGSCMGGFEPFREIRLEESQGYAIVNGKIYIYDDDLKKDFQYSYRVYPVTRRGTSGESSNVFTITWHTPPVPPTGIAAKGDYGKIEITWTKEDGRLYNVYRLKANTYPLFPVNTEPFSAPPFIDSGLENGVTYQYEVRSVAMQGGMRREGEGALVAAAPVDRLPPAAPRGIKTEKKGRGVLIGWLVGKEEDLVGYNIYRIIGGKGAKVNGEPVKEPMFMDESPPGLRYVTYYVTAVDKWGNESEASKESIIILMKE
jgi:hypothetical protein